MKRAKLWLGVLLPVLALGWIAWHGFARDSRVYSSGRLSGAHAVLEKECATCHVQKAGVFAAKAENNACLACHDGPAHHSSRVAEPDCATCHVEHRGRVNLSAARNQTCAECHSNLRAAGGTSHFAANIRSFQDGHPEFRSVSADARDPGTIKLNHAIHMKPIRRGPTGPIVQLECGNCHRATAAAPDLTYADAKYRAAAVTYKESEGVLLIRTLGFQSAKPVSGRELMAPVKFANACAACHLLTFDKRFDFGAPHDKPGVVHAFLVTKFTEYIGAHPGELHEVREPKRDLAGKPLQPVVRTYTPNEWITVHVHDAEELLWRKTCKQCHALNFLKDDGKVRIPQSALESSTAGEKSMLPYVEPAAVTLVWMPHSQFDHDAHRGFTCESCHVKALTSKETSDVLLPSIATCQTCHAPGPEHAESRCFECHTYHDWSKRKEVTPKFTLPALRTAGR
jgi:hypothetical protein